ncbi:MAG TPA: hypothetical protein DDX71_05215 [Ruminococcus sp.]|nr:hypothetical protein [Ruminococcus sp.]
MKLATALMNRADLQKKLDELQLRLNNNARVQEGEQPAESPTELLAELDSVSGELETLIARINLTNAQTIVDGLTVTERIAHRDILLQKQRIYRNFLDEASNLAQRYSRTEIRQESTVSVRELQKQLDAISKELRLTEEALQELNWTVELL